MKLLLVSQNQRIQHPTSISDSFLRAFKNEKVDCQNYDLTYYINRYSNYLIKRTPKFRHFLLKGINHSFLDYVKSHNFNHILVIKGTFLLPETLQILHQQGVSVSCFNPDDPFNPQTWGGSNHPIILDAIPFYDHYFIWSKKLISLLKEKGVKNVHYLPFALDNALIKTFPDIREKYDLSFIGNADDERQKWINTCADLLSNQSDIKNIDIFGIYWKNHTNINLNGSRFGDNYFKVFYESKVNINILRDQNKGETNMRTFEIPATGNFMLHEQSEGAAEFFRPDIDAVYFSSPQELIDKANYYVKNDVARKKIALSGYQQTLKTGFTYNDRIKEIIQQIGI